MMENNKLNKLKKDFDNIEIPPELDFKIEEGIKKASIEKKKKKYFIPAASGICAAVLLIVIIISSNLKYDSKLSTNKPQIKTTASLPIVGSEENMKKLLAKINESSKENTTKGGAVAKTEANKKSDSKWGNSNAINYSKTNTQVENVEEGDICKTDGEYIYKANGTNVSIIKAYPVQDMKIVKTLSYEQNFQPLELLLEKNYLVVIGLNYNYNKQPTLVEGVKNITYTKVYVYDISDKYNLKEVKSFEVSGIYSTSRMTSSSLYILCNQPTNSYTKYGDNVIQPSFKDSSTTKDYTNIGFDKIQYCPDTISNNYILIATLNFSNMNSQVGITTILGPNSNIYASEKNIYVTGINYSKKENTKIYKFSMQPDSVTFAGESSVPGHLLNQFSMDEYKDYFRAAVTTYGESNNIDDSSNAVYILDNNLQIKGKLENLAKGEKIYSVRFIGDKGYMVTFKQTDPLFVLDLKNPENPSVAGELKIPGFSSYLHPYDENHIIGIGKDTENTDEAIVKTKGLKIAMFDVTDMKNPKQMFSTVIGDHGSSSDVLYNHKAFLLWKEKNILALPARINTFDPSKDGVLKDNSYFEGEYIYTIDLQKGFNLKGTITHKNISNDDTSSKIEDNNMSSYGKYVPSSYINRTMYIENILYTLSDGYIKANDIDSLKELNSVYIK